MILPEEARAARNENRDARLALKQAISDAAAAGDDAAHAAATTAYLEFFKNQGPQVEKAEFNDKIREAKRAVKAADTAVQVARQKTGAPNLAELKQQLLIAQGVLKHIEEAKAALSGGGATLTDANAAAA